MANGSKGLFGVLLIVLGAGPCFAGTQSGYITLLRTHRNETGSVVKADVALDGNYSSPACQMAEWTMDLTDPANNAAFSMLLTAYTSHKAVAIDGNADCSVDGSRETVHCCPV